MASGSSQRWIGDFCFHASVPLDPELREELRRVARRHVVRAVIHGVITIPLLIVGFFMAILAATEGVGWLVLLGAAMVVGSLIALMRTGASDIKRGVALRAIKCDEVDEYHRVMEVENFDLDRYLDSLDDEHEPRQEGEPPAGWLGASTIGVSGGRILLVDGRLTLDGERVDVRTVADVSPDGQDAAHRSLSDAEVEELNRCAGTYGTAGCLVFVVVVSILTPVFGWLLITKGWAYVWWFIGGALVTWAGWAGWVADRRTKRLVLADLRERRVFRWVAAPKKYPDSAPVEFLQRSGLIWSVGGWPSRARRSGYQLEHLPSQNHRRRGR